MQKFLLLQIYGPLSAWGEIAVGEERPSSGHPSRSAVLGLLAAANGVRRHEEDLNLAMAKGYGVAVRVESRGTSLKDYHTVQVPPQVALKRHPHVTRRDEIGALASHKKKNPNVSGTILSNRGYRCDAIYQIAVWRRKDAPFPLDDLAASLSEPRFVLYLGRKSCPLALPLQAQVVEAETLTEAFGKAEFVPLSYFGKERTREDSPPSDTTVSLFWDDDVKSGISPRETFIRRDQILSRKRWQFEERREHHATWKVSED